MSNWTPLVMAYRRIVLSLVTILRCSEGLILTHKKIIPNLHHGRECCHQKCGELAHRWMAPPHALALCKLLHQALEVRVRELCSILLNIVVPLLVNLVDGPGSEVNPLTSDKHYGFDLEWQVGVELLDDRGHSGGRGST